MNAILAIAFNDLRHLFRDRMSLFFAAVFPIIISVFFGTIFSGPGPSEEDGHKIKLMVCDEDASSASRSLVNSLRSAAELTIQDAPDREPALNRVREGDAPALLVIPKGYGARQQAMFLGESSEILLAVDPSRRAEAGMLEGILTRESFAQLQDAFTDPAVARSRVKSAVERLRSDASVSAPQRAIMDNFFSRLDTFLQAIPADRAVDAEPGAAASSQPTTQPTTRRAVFQPVAIKRLDLTRPQTKARAGPPSSFAITFAQGVVWGVMGCALGFSMALSSERTRGTMLRLRVAPLTPTHIVIGKAAACFIATFGVGIMVMLVGIVFFGVRPTSYPLLLLAALCVAWCFVGIMMLLAAFGRTERGGNSLGWGVLLMLSMIGGGMIPLFFMPAWMQSLSVISPIRYAVLALEGAIWRDFTLSQMFVPTAVLLTVGVVGVLVGARLVAKHST